MLDGRRETVELQSALAAGEELAFKDLLDWLGPRLHRAAARMLGSREDADDAVQEVFVSLVRSRKCLRNVDSLPAYSFVVLHRTIGRMLKSQRRQPELLCSLHDHAESTSDSIDIDEEALELAIQSLPPEQREVVVLRIDGGLTFAEISVLLEVNSNTAASRYRYALQKMRDELGARS